MATILEKDLLRESTIKCDDRNIMVTLTKDQEISLKLKGMKSGSVSIDIEELYGQLTGESCSDKPTKSSGSLNISHDQPKVGSKKNPMISLYDLRSQSAIASLDYDTKVKFDTIINNLINTYK